MALVGIEEKVVPKKHQECYLFQCDAFGNEIMYVVKKHILVVKEGQSDKFFFTMVQ